jgi:hypothetical protein
MPDSQWSKWKLVVKRALETPVSIAMLAIGAIWAVATQDTTGVLVLIGALAATGVYVSLKLRDEAFIRRVLREAGERRRESDLMARTFKIEELDVDSRVRMKAIVKLQNEIAEDVANSPVDEVASGLSGTVNQTAELIERGLAMAQKRRELQRYLTRTDPADIERRAAGLEEKLRSETDSTRRAEIEASLRSKRQEIDDFHAIEKASARVLDQLDTIQVAFEGLRARLVRIRSTDIAEWTAANEELKTELGGLVTAADSVEKSIEEALTVGGSNAEA